MEPFKFCFILIVMPLAKSSPPGTFFWKPRMQIRLGGGKIRAEELQMPTVENVMDGKVVLVRSFQCGMAMIMLAEGIEAADTFAHLNPTRGYFYTNAYRWAWRHFSLIPRWLAADDQNYYSTHRVWKKRFMYMNKFIPNWMTYLLPFVPRSDWANERREYRRFEKFAELAFAKRFRFTSKTFNDFKSQEDSPSIPSSSMTNSFNSKSKK